MQVVRWMLGLAALIIPSQPLAALQAPSFMTPNCDCCFWPPENASHIFRWYDPNS